MDSHNGCNDLQRYIYLLMAEFKYPFMEKVLKRYASYVIQQAKANLTKDKKGGGELYNSLTSKSGENKEELFVQFFMENYGRFVNEGVKGKNPSKVSINAKIRGQQAPNSPFKFGSGNYSGTWGTYVKSIESWAKKKNVRFRNSKGQYAKGNYKSLAYIISNNIYNRGLKPTLFFSKPFDAGLDKFSNNLLMAFVSDTQNNVGI